MKTILMVILCYATLALNAATWEEYKVEVLSHQKELEGWCSIEKANKLMDLVYKTKPNVCAEIGVFGGSSIYPTASALRFISQGVVFAIDPWSVDECLKGYEKDDPNFIWWSQVNLEKIYQSFQFMLKKFQLAGFCKILKMNSKKALEQFTDESIDILHIDGNHSKEIALADVQMFLPKVKKGGYIWFDDADWPSAYEAVTYLLKYCSLDTEGSVEQKCFLFQKN